MTIICKLFLFITVSMIRSVDSFDTCKQLPTAISLWFNCNHLFASNSCSRRVVRGGNVWRVKLLSEWCTEPTFVHPCISMYALNTYQVSMLICLIVTPCKLVDRYQGFGGTYCFHLQGWYGVTTQKPNIDTSSLNNLKSPAHKPYQQQLESEISCSRGGERRLQPSGM
jgi:hypothetical protein